MKIEILTADDWVAVYKDGERVWNNHSCPLEAGLEALGIPYTSEDLDPLLDDIGELKDGSGRDPFPERL
jgi:hypothetical protein